MSSAYLWVMGSPRPDTNGLSLSQKSIRDAISYQSLLLGIATSNSCQEKDVGRSMATAWTIMYHPSGKK